MTSPNRPALPRQENLTLAISRGLDCLRRQNDSMLAWLGAGRDGLDRICVSVLGKPLSVDFEGNRLVFEDGQPADMRWQVLVLHYLNAPTPVEPTGREMVFADIRDTRGYQGVYEGRVIKRLCFTVGRTAETLNHAALAIGGHPCEGEGDLAFRFDVLPRIPLRMAWYAGDEDFPPNATFLFQSNATDLLPPEDIVVLSELVVSQMTRFRNR
jgi:hypothetical protein